MKNKSIKKIKKLGESEIGRGGDAGEVFIVAKKIVGDGKITADGGDGSIGGRGGKVTIISKDNQFAGQVSAKGGKSLSSYRKWWENSLIQGIALIAAILGIIGFFLFIK
jgi:hypothetical protein